MTREVDSKTIYIAGLLAWLIPGAGHWIIGQKNRGTIIFITIVTTFLLGVILGGIEMIDPKASPIWFAGQVLSGLPGLAEALIQNPSVKAGVGRGVDLGQVYTCVAGLLNLICVMDVLMRCQKLADPSIKE